MQIGKRAALGGAVLALAAMPAAAMGARPKAKITVSSIAAVPVSVVQGGAFELAGRVRAAKRRKPAAGRLRVDLRTLTNTPAPQLATARIRRLAPGRSRAFTERIVVPDTVPEGVYLVRACAKRKTGGAYRCRIAKGRLGVTTPPAPADARHASVRLREAITQTGLRSHLEDLQRISDIFGGNRAAGLPGHAQSARHVVDVLEAAGYSPQTQVVPFDFFRQNGPATFVRTDVAPDDPYVEEDEFGVLAHSGPADGDDVQDVPVDAVDLDLGVGNESTSGCEPADFAGFPAGSVALIQRGGCDLGVKAANAEAAGAAGVIVFNQGDTIAQDRTGPFSGTLGAPAGIPVFSLPYAAGAELGAAAAATVSMVVSTTNEPRTTANVWADTAGGDPSSVIVVGSHLDSVTAGPGINDNATGSAFTLEAAVQMARLGITPTKKVRFAFWAAGELGQLGSDHYVAQLSPAQLAAIRANLNVDTLGSPNHAKFVYDGDFSDTDSGGLPVNTGAAEIERLFVEHFSSAGVPTEPVALDGRSDHAPFQAAGIPVGGLFSGADGVKTAAQAAKWGGTAGQPYDPCHHDACDTLANVDLAGLEQLADGAAHVLATLATRQANPGGG